MLVIPLTIIFSVPALLWFARHWTIVGNDSGRYLLAASDLIAGEPLAHLQSVFEFNGGHGPTFPALIGALVALFGRDTGEVV